MINIVSFMLQVFYHNLKFLEKKVFLNFSMLLIFYV